MVSLSSVFVGENIFARIMFVCLELVGNKDHWIDCLLQTSMPFASGSNRLVCPFEEMVMSFELQYVVDESPENQFCSEYPASG